MNEGAKRVLFVQIIWLAIQMIFFQPIVLPWVQGIYPQHNVPLVAEWWFRAQMQLMLAYLVYEIFIVKLQRYIYIKWKEYRNSEALKLSNVRTDGVVKELPETPKEVFGTGKRLGVAIPRVVPTPVVTEQEPEEKKTYEDLMK
jgi:hypothetical protein